MVDGNGTLRDCIPLSQGVLLRVQLADPAATGQPGQFYLLRCGGAGPYLLRRPLFPSDIDRDSLTFWGRPAYDPGLAWLAAQPLETPVDLLGPFGKGFVVHPQPQRLLLVAEAAHVGALLALIGPHLGRGSSVGLLLQGATQAELLPASALPPAVEYYSATADGSAGHPGNLDELLPTFLLWADLVCAAGAASFLGRLKRAIGATRFGVGAGFAQVVAPVPLPCGIGACLACLVDTGRGWHRACQRGPVFDLVELAL